MKKLSLLIIAGIVSASLMAAPPSRTQLYKGWKVQSSATAGADGSRISGTSSWYDASVPSTAMGVLMDNGVLPADLLDGFNYKNSSTRPGGGARVSTSRNSTATTR